MRTTLRYRLLAIIAVTVALVAVPVFAAEIAGGEIYRLEAGNVVEDDLIVSAQEVYIDGVVQGDLIAVASYVEVNGTVEGDLIAGGAEVRLNGTVNDDVRVVGAGVTIDGAVGDDLFAAAGGGEGTIMYSQVGERQVRQGLHVERSATVGGSAYLAAGDATMAGVVEEDLAVGAGKLTLAGVVQGDANLDVASLKVADAARVDGRLTYTTNEQGSIPAGTAGDVRFEPRPPQPVDQGPSLGSQLIRLLLTLAGFALLGWLMLRFVPRIVERPAHAIAARPAEAGLYGLIAALVLFIVPILSVAILVAIVLFWGWFPGLMFFLFLTAALALAWTLSPLITGLWIGELILNATGRPSGAFAALMLGVTVIVLLGFVPVIGWLVYLVSLVLAVGGVLLVRRGSVDMRPVNMAPMPA